MSEWTDILAARLAGKRLFPDVSVLLAGLLYPDCPSREVLFSARSSKVLVSPHTEETSLHVLRRHSPTLLGEFSSELLRLAAANRLERVSTASPSSLDASASRLSSEDKQVLADCIQCRADVLYTHDSMFFTLASPGIEIVSPATHTWHPQDDRWFHPGRTTWSFLGQFKPLWNSRALRSTTRRFYVLEIAGHSRCYYDASDQAFRFETAASGDVALHVPCDVRTDTTHLESLA